jgi:hypothetical protein
VGCSAHLLHRGVAIAIVGGFLIFLFLLRFFAFLLHFVSSVAPLALVTVFVLLLYVDFYLALGLLFLLFRLYFRLVLGVGGNGERFAFAIWVHQDIRVDGIPDIG